MHLLPSLAAFFGVLPLLQRCAAQIDYEVEWTACPPACSLVPDRADWWYYSSEYALSLCDQTMLLELNLYNDIGDPATHLRYRSCSASPGTTSPNLAKRQILDFNSNLPNRVTAPVHLASWGDAAADGSQERVSTALSALRDFVQTDSASATSLFASTQGIIAGIFVGPQIQSDSAVDLVNLFLTHVQSGALQQRQAAQICKTSELSDEAQYFGIIYDTTGELAFVQNALQTWHNATCLSGTAENTILSTTTIDLIPGNEISVGPEGVTDHPILEPRATCNYTVVKSGDSCYSLSQYCGITLSQFESYNGGSSYCNSLQPGEYACCSSGSPPNFAPQPYSNGTCYTYYVQSGDTCSSIASAHQEQVTAITNNNNNTWGWQGCSDLFIGSAICLSSGNPPFPATVANAVCGPQVNNTQLSSNYKQWSLANQCPLNACCDIYGQCGITSDFCTPDPSSTGAPGTAAPGSNGCISNCGTQILGSSAPSSFGRLGYFEGFNNQRPCMNMAPSDISASYYDIVHFAFANISSNYDVVIGTETAMWDEFLNQGGYNKVLSFGGWAFSTDPSTYPIFRQGVTPAERTTFAQNVANFVQSNNIQGVDFDWEYPGPSIIPGIPSGSPQDGANYLAFLQELRSILPGGYTISITAPASFYYLKNFPIANMSLVVDYIVFMTYDLHGQWDYGNQFTDPGCPAGNCLRSQINQTETQSALSMITKAGVPANMIYIGQPLYGRSFQMTQAGCYTNECTFTGPASGAFPGPCTGTPGYIGNWEINQIIYNNTQYSSTVQQYYDAIAGDILVYASTQWISWMKPSTYNARSSWVQGLNFAGTADWAIDLNASYSADGTQIGEGSGVVYIPPSIYSSASPTVTCLPPCTFVFPPWTLSTMTTISMPASTMTLREIWPEVSTVSGGVTTTVYVSSIITTTFTVPPITTNTISVWNVEWTNTANATLYLTSSVVFPDVTLTEKPLTTSTTTIAGAIFTFAPGAFPIIGPNPGPPGPPPPGFPGPGISVVRGPPGPTCTPGEIGCGSLCQGDCEPSLPCIGICGCIGIGCPSGGGGGGGGGEGDCVGAGCEEDGESSSCATSSTVTNCQVDCSVTNFGDTSTATDCYTKVCSQVVGCEAEGSTSTSETTTAVCALSTPAPPVWTPVSGAQIPFLGTDLVWTTPGQQTAPSKTSPTSPGGTGGTGGTGSNPTPTQPNNPPPSSASPSQMLVFTDTECQDFYYATTINNEYDKCFEFNADINSYIIGETDNCGCTSPFCIWDVFVLTTSTGCGTDDEVGGGCNVPNCTKTSGPARFNTAEEADNGGKKKKRKVAKRSEGSVVLGDWVD